MTSTPDLLFKTDWSTDSTVPFSLLRSHPKATVRGTLIAGCVVYCETQLQVHDEHAYFTGWKTIDLHRDWQTAFLAPPRLFRFVFPTGPLISPTDPARIRSYEPPPSSGLRALRDLSLIEDTITQLGTFLLGKGITRTVIFPDPIDISDNGATPVKVPAGSANRSEFVVPGPSKALYEDFVRAAMVKLYTWPEDLTKLSNDKAGEKPFSDPLINRAGIISVFRNMNPNFEMLFTADTYDAACDIRETIWAWKGTAPPRMHFDVLKVPHHGASTTAKVGFYTNVTADVYLISARQGHLNHPALSCLEAIAKGSPNTVGSTVRPRPLFFSDEEAEKDLTVDPGPPVVTEKSNVGRLLRGPYAPNLVATAAKPVIRNYRCYRLRLAPPPPRPPAPPSRRGLTAGRILFGADANGDLVVQFTVALSDTDADLTRDWVEMKP